MKKFLFSIAALLMAFTANAQDMELTLGALTVDEGIGYLDVDFKSGYDIVGWQMYIKSPEGLEPAAGELNERYEYNKIKKNYYHSVDFTKTSDGDYLAVCYALDAKHNAIEGQEGRLVQLLFDAEKFTGNAAEAEIEIYKFSVALADASQINMEGSVTTGIDFITREISADGNNAVYNLKGQRVEKAGKGLYIVNGKKVVK